MKYSEKDIKKVLDTVEAYLSNISVSKLKRRAICEEIESTLKIENIKFEARRKVKMKKLSKAMAIAKANRLHPAKLQEQFEATGTEYVCSNGKVVDVVKKVTAADIKKELKGEGKLAWSLVEFVDWIFHKYPECRDYTVKEIVNIAKAAGVRIV